MICVQENLSRMKPRIMMRLLLLHSGRPTHNVDDDDGSASQSVAKEFAPGCDIERICLAVFLERGVRIISRPTGPLASLHQGDDKECACSA